MQSSASTVTISQLFTNMIGTLAVILIVAAFIGGSEFMPKHFGSKSGRKYSVFLGILGGLFGIYGTLSGLELNGAIISVRDIGPMLAGFTGGPIGGLVAGVIAGVHRFLVGSTASTTAMQVTWACILATVSIGTMCGFLSGKLHERSLKPLHALLTGMVMEIFHLSLLLLIVRPFAAALGIVRAIFLPFILVNAVGFTLMIALIGYIEKQRSIAMERSRLKTELEVATVIQRSLLPPITDTFPGRKELAIAASMDPAKEVGGDFYDFFFVDRDRIAFVIADVSGKGIPAALFMATSKTTLQNCVRDYPDLAEAVTIANDSLCRNNTAEMFVTAWIGVLDIPAGKLSFVCAGHNPPVLLSAGKASFLRRRTGFVLGGMEGIRYREESLELHRDDVLFLYTDGVTEAENASHDLFGEDRLAACLERSAERSPDAIVSEVRKAIDAHASGADQFDDITMLCIRCTGAGLES